MKRSKTSQFQEAISEMAATSAPAIRRQFRAAQDVLDGQGDAPL